MDTSNACGDNELQRDAVFALGATEWQAQDTTKSFFWFSLNE